MHLLPASHLYKVQEEGDLEPGPFSNTLLLRNPVQRYLLLHYQDKWPQEVLPFLFFNSPGRAFHLKSELLLLYHIAVLQGKLMLRSLTLKASILEC